MSNLAERYTAAMNKIAKWRLAFAGWQLGTRAKGDPESDAVRDHREATILQRVEVNAIINLLVDKGVITVEELQKAAIEEADLLEQSYQKNFPGMQATDIGMQFDTRAAKTMHNWKP